MNNLNYKVGDEVQMRKNHPCGTNEFIIIRCGADIKIKCNNCGHIIMLSRVEFNKKIKRVINDDK